MTSLIDFNSCRRLAAPSAGDPPSQSPLGTVKSIAISAGSIKIERFAIDAMVRLPDVDELMTVSMPQSIRLQGNTLVINLPDDLPAERFRIEIFPRDEEKGAAA